MSFRGDVEPCGLPKKDKVVDALSESVLLARNAIVEMQHMYRRLRKQDRMNRKRLA
jgi:hypothetical protein